MFAWKSILGMTQPKRPMLYPVAIYSVKGQYSISFISISSDHHDDDLAA